MVSTPAPDTGLILQYMTAGAMTRSLNCHSTDSKVSLLELQMQSQVTSCRFVMASWHWNSVLWCVQYTAHYRSWKQGLQQSDLALGGAYSREYFHS